MREAMLKNIICPQKVEKFCGEVLPKVISVGP
jgi:hypothetical protein